MTGEGLYCSFCGKESRAVFLLIAGPTVFICNECVELCRDLIGRARIERAEKVLQMPRDRDATLAETPSAPGEAGPEQSEGIAP